MFFDIFFSESSSMFESLTVSTIKPLPSFFTSITVSLWMHPVRKTQAMIAEKMVM
jgi:hypothetical protein